jgi:hypothetical protein
MRSLQKIPKDAVVRKSHRTRGSAPRAVTFSHFIFFSRKDTLMLFTWRAAGTTAVTGVIVQPRTGFRVCGGVSRLGIKLFFRCGGSGMEWRRLFSGQTRPQPARRHRPCSGERCGPAHGIEGWCWCALSDEDKARCTSLQGQLHLPNHQSSPSPTSPSTRPPHKQTSPPPKRLLTARPALHMYIPHESRCYGQMSP